MIRRASDRVNSREAAEILGVTRQELARLRTSGKFRFYRIRVEGKKAFEFDRQEIAAYAELRATKAANLAKKKLKLGVGK